MLRWPSLLSGAGILAALQAARASAGGASEVDRCVDLLCVLILVGSLIRRLAHGSAAWAGGAAVDLAHDLRGPVRGHPGEPVAGKARGLRFLGLAVSRDRTSVPADSPFDPNTRHDSALFTQSDDLNQGRVWALGRTLEDRLYQDKWATLFRLCGWILLLAGCTAALSWLLYRWAW